jgi:DNA-directed RNA polymerase subunit RPC12/RpoP
MIAPLQCVTCNAPLVLIDAPSVACRFCGAINAMPEAYREELRLSRDLDEATRRAIQEWARLDRIKASRWWFVCAASAPFVFMTGGLVIILAARLRWIEMGASFPLLVGVYVWLPLVPLQFLAAKVAMRNLLVSGAASVGAAFAAIPPSRPGDPPNCRECGAPLTVEPDDVLVRCVYCEAESIVQLNKLEMQSLRSRVGSAQSSLAQAMAALAKQARLARLQTCGRTCVIAGFLILPLIWSFVRSWQTSYWSLLIALDVWVLGMCVFWSVREAFLPPVMIEELDTLMEPSTESAPQEAPAHAPGTRGWYDHASDGVNFLVPALVTLMFVAIEMIVITASRK